jgi:N-methylhydantoinase A
MEGDRLVKLVGVDIGGTFTDIILVDTESGETSINKVPTTTDDPSRGMVQGILALTAGIGVDPADLEHVFHGTTIATNAMLEHQGARAGMITTEGYRDIIHIGRHQRPQHYSIMQDIPWQDRPLVQRRFRKVVRERLAPPHGDVLIELDEEQVRRAVRELKAAGVESIAVCLLFSYLNPAHEDRVREIVRKEYPEVFVTTSSSIFPQFREFERFTTACINAFVGPGVKRYVENLASSLKGSGIEGDLHIMRSNGGVATATAAAEKPVTLLLSGPAAGVLGGAWSGRLSGRGQVITFDVGGTSADIGIVTARGLTEASARDTWVAGFPVMVPMIDVHTIGAGGGSIAYVDAGGAFRVGPRSAGATPGPACYGKGGAEPTVTDANLVLARLDEAHFLGGEMPIYRALAEDAVRGLAGRLGFDLYEAAEGIITIVNHNMANAIRARTVQKGQDPRAFSLVAFGGAGPLHAAEVAESLDIPEVIVPPYPGITSATGLLTTDLKYDDIRTEFMLDAEIDVDRLNEHFDELDASVRGQLRRDRIPDEQITTARSADCRYAGQGYELRVEVPAGTLTDEAVPRILQGFHDLHRAEYGYAFEDHPIELVSIRVVGIGTTPKLASMRAQPGTMLDDAWLSSGEVYFRRDGELTRHATNYFRRHRLPMEERVDGPAVLFQRDSTTLIPPGWSARADGSDNLILTRGDHGRPPAGDGRSDHGTA